MHYTTGMGKKKRHTHTHTQKSMLEALSSCRYPVNVALLSPLQLDLHWRNSWPRCGVVILVDEGSCEHVGEPYELPIWWGDKLDWEGAMLEVMTSKRRSEWVCYMTASGSDGHIGSGIDDGEGDGDAVCGRTQHMNHPLGLFRQDWVVWEERRHSSIAPKNEEDEVKSGAVAGSRDPHCPIAHQLPDHKLIVLSSWLSRHAMAHWDNVTREYRNLY